jgi:hypothetical protein
MSDFPAAIGSAGKNELLTQFLSVEQLDDPILF